MLYGLDIGNNSLSLGAMSLRSQIESASQMFELVTTVGCPSFGEVMLFEIAAQLVHFLYQQRGDCCSYFWRKTGIV